MHPTHTYTLPASKVTENKTKCIEEEEGKKRRTKQASTQTDNTTYYICVLISKFCDCCDRRGARKKETSLKEYTVTNIDQMHQWT